jgi:Polyketide cyclase / dehydrase and lipid transport
MAYATAATRDVAAPARTLWQLVSDLPRMGEWSPENKGGKWVKGATGPALGAVFKGNNKNGVRRWSTTVTVVESEPGKVFEFAVTSGPLAVARWRYEFEDTDTGCRVTESWVDERKPWFATIARVMGDHSAKNAEHQMTETLDNLAREVEKAPGASHHDQAAAD